MRIYIGAAGDQQLRYVEMILDNGPHQARLGVLQIFCVHVGAPVEELFYGFDSADPGSRHQNRLTTLIGSVGIGARVQKLRDHGGVTVHRGETQRIDPVPKRLSRRHRLQSGLRP